MRALLVAALLAPCAAAGQTPDAARIGSPGGPPAGEPAPPAGPAPSSETAPPGPDAEAGPAEAPILPSLAIRGHLDWITSAGVASSRATPVDPGNRLLRIPAGGARSELRPDLKLEWGQDLAGVARPRFVARVERAYTGDGWLAERSEATAEWIEGYASWRVSRRISVSYGLQNFQWGPAELTSPSNRIFRSTGFYRDPVYVVRGRQLVRVNLSAGREWSVVLLAEVGPNGEAPFVAGEPFEQKALAKVEYQLPRGDAYVAAVAGAGQRSRGWFGEYAAVPLAAGLSAYGDAVHTVGRLAWYPEPDPLVGAWFAKAGMETRRLVTTALGGLRYAFENGDDLRVEYLFDEAGWTDRQLGLAEKAALASLPDPTGIQRFLDPGFELLGRHLVYASVHLPDLPPHRKTDVQVRYLRSLGDGSGVGFATVSWAATDSVVVFLSISAAHGPADGALSRLSRAAAAAGATVSW